MQQTPSYVHGNTPTPHANNEQTSCQQSVTTRLTITPCPSSIIHHPSSHIQIYFLDTSGLGASPNLGLAPPSKTTNWLFKKISPKMLNPMPRLL